MRFAFCFALLFAIAAPAQVAPRIFYSDLDSGPNTGGENNLGVYVSIYGNGFGSAPGAVTVGGGAVANYKIWTNTKVVFQLGPAAASGNILLSNSAGLSNGVPFTVRPGNIYFVATNGNDSAAGSVSAPWRTLLHARDTVAAGDTVYARNGVAQSADDGQGWSACFTIGGISGSAGKPIAMVVYPGETATIGDISACGSGIRTKGAGESYWTVAGFNLRGAGEALTTSVGLTNGVSPQYWRIVANDMTCPNGNGASACYETGQSGYLKVYGNNVHDTGTANASALYQGVYFSTDTNHVDFGWNTIANVHGCRGLQIHSSPLQGGGPNDPTGYNQYDLSIHDNVIHDTQCDGIVMYTVDPSKGPVQVYNNVIYNAGKGPNNPEGSGAWSCIYVGAYTNDGPAGSGTIDVFNNTLYNCGSFPNPPYSSSSAGVLFAGPDALKNLRLRNNIIDQSPDPSIPYILAGNPDGSGCSPCSRVTGSNNLVFGGVGSLDSNFTATLNTAPLFANAAGYDFRLLANSPAVTAGTPTPQPTDINGYPFAAGYPIGAYNLYSSPGCVYSVATPPEQPYEGSTVALSVTLVIAGQPNCSWSASSSLPWVTVNGNSLTFSPNGGNAPRSGVVTIAGQTIAVSQWAAITYPTSFVTELYQDLLNRPPDASGLAYWVGQLNSGTVTRASLAAQFFTSAEFSANGLYVIKLYTAILGRNPDFAGWNYWFSAMDSGTPAITVLSSFLTSNEFVSTYGNITDNTAFVTLVYQNVLGRAPDSGGLSYWVGQLNSGLATRAGVMATFVTSGEYNTLILPRAYANLLYMGFLRRIADPSGLAYWTGILNNLSTLPSVINGFISSGEYIARF